MKRIFEKLGIPPQKRTSLNEIRLRVNKPAMLLDKNKAFTLNKILTKRELEEIFRLMCDYSVYSKQNEIKNGFITLKGGHRAGICGTAVYDKGEIINIRDISAINLRIACEHKGCSDKLMKNIKINSGILLCGAPCSGKTTMLRDIARKLSEHYKVAVIDTRGELAATYQGENGCDVGTSFVLDGYSKTDGFDHALRCLSPDYIICDEIGTAQDALSVENAVNSGVGIICSAHCNNTSELLSKPILKNIVKYFDNIFFLGNRENVGQVIEETKSYELIS